MFRASIRLLGVLGLAACASSVSAQETQETADADIVAVVHAYFDAWMALNNPGADAAAYARYDSLFTSDMVYEIPARDMVFPAEDFLGGEPSDDNRTRSMGYSIEALLVADGVAFVRAETTSDMRDRDGNWGMRSQTEHLVFEFENDKISRVIDY